MSDQDLDILDRLKRLRVTIDGQACLPHETLRDAVDEIESLRDELGRRRMTRRDDWFEATLWSCSIECHETGGPHTRQCTSRRVPAILNTAPPDHW